MKTAYFSPFLIRTNAYIEMQKSLLRELGFAVKPVNLRAVFTGRAFGILKPGNLMVFHWLETRVFRQVNSRSRIDMGGLLAFVFYYGLMLIARAKVIYFVHDHAAHDTQGRLQRFSVALIRWLLRASDAHAVHDPSCETRYDARYLPHPLYWDAGRAASLTAAPAPLSDTPRFAIVGAIRPYKGIDRVLSCWPQGAKLKISGDGAAEYCAVLRDIIAARNLQSDVELAVGFLSAAEFDHALCAADVLILPHLSGTMLVSGAFFEGIGRVKAIVARRTPFIDWAARQLPSIYGFEQDAEIPAMIAAIQKDWPQLRCSDASEGARRLFGWQHCLERYRAFYASVCEGAVLNAQKA